MARVLVVDDDESIRTVLAECLAREGHTATKASGGNALEILKLHTLEVALVDIVMPEISGHELAAMMREKDPEMKIALMTGYPGEGHAEIEQTSFEAVLAKPFGLEEISRVMGELIG